MTMHAIRTEQKYITGAILKMTLVVSLYIAPFLNNLTTSFTGCISPGPFLPEVMLFVRRIIPEKKMLQNSIKIILSMLQII
jgi:hypothetical protein